MMYWYVIGLIVTVLWGNGAVEEGRTTWDGVFYGTPAQCEARAEQYRQERQAEPISDASRRPDVRHAIQPRVYFGGIRDMRYASGVCARFDSEEAIKATFPDGWRVMPGQRVGGDSVVGFAWWDGPKGEVFANHTP